MGWCYVVGCAGSISLVDYISVLRFFGVGCAGGNDEETFREEEGSCVCICNNGCNLVVGARG